MARWTLIQNSVVKTIVVQDNQPSPGFWMNVTGQSVSPGDTWTDDQFNPPLNFNITANGLWGRFTFEELVTLEVTKQHPPSGTNQQKIDAATLRVYVDTVNQHNLLEMASAYGDAFFAAMVAQNVLTQQRANEISLTQVGSNE